MSTYHLAEFFCGEALETTSYILISVPNEPISKRHFLNYGQEDNLVWIIFVWVVPEAKIYNSQIKKTDPKSTNCNFADSKTFPDKDS